MKFHNRRTHSFDSRLEYKRHLVLLQAERDGAVRNLRTQVAFEVIPRQTEWVEVQLKTKTKMVARVVERNCEYIADFVYEKRTADGWVEVVEDTKSEVTRRLPEYVMKRKLMRLQGHPIHEVLKAGDKI